MTSTSLPVYIAPRKDLANLRLLNFGVWFMLGVYVPYVNVYYRSIGLSGTQIGLVNMLGALLGALSTGYWGYLQDRTGKNRLLFALACGGLIGSTLALSQARSFPLILIASGLVSLFAVPLLSMIDVVTMHLLGAHTDRYGQYRVWGTVGFIISNMVSGAVYERTGLRPMFAALIVLVALFLILTQRLPDQAGSGLAARQKGGLGRLFAQPAWLVFASSVLLLWAAFSGANNFLGIVVKTLGGTESTISLIFTVGALAEMPMMIFSAPLLARFGAKRFLILAYTGFTVRMVLYSLMTVPSWAVWIAAMHLITYGPFWVGGVAYSRQLAPAHLRATSQGLLFTVMNLGNLSGSLLAGWLFDHTGYGGMFQGLAVLAGLALLLFVLGERLVPKPGEPVGA